MFLWNILEGTIKYNTQILLCSHTSRWMRLKLNPPTDMKEMFDIIFKSAFTLKASIMTLSLFGILDYANGKY